MIKGNRNHRIPNKPHKKPRMSGGLRADHPAVLEGRTLFPTTVVHPFDSPRLLVSGMNQRKIGKIVRKGRWKGMPIFCLTLEERATCPTTCNEWRTCYGSNMHRARRHAHGIDLETKLINEIVTAGHKYPKGFVMRLHILGDFYSQAYVDLWSMLLEEVPQLRIFGYTAHDYYSEMGKSIDRLNMAHLDRVRIRFSNADLGSVGSMVINDKSESTGVICPVQTDETDCCATCGLCWTMDKTVEFLRH